MAETVNVVNTMNGTQLPITDVESQNEEKTNSKWHLAKIYFFNSAALFIIYLILGLSELALIPSHKPGFVCNDPKLSFKYDGDTVPDVVLGSTVVLIPIVIFFITEYIYAEGTRRERSFASLKCTLYLLRTYVWGLTFNFFAIECMKFIKADPRPTFFDMCNPDTGRTCVGSEYVSTFECQPDPRFWWWKQTDSYHSFPSGHTSTSVFCAILVSWYLQRRAFAWSSTANIMVPMVQALLIFYATICSLTRITDHRHHWWDVLTGFFVGVITAVYAVIVLAKNFKSAKSDDNVQTPKSYPILYDARTEHVVL